MVNNRMNRGRVSCNQNPQGNTPCPHDHGTSQTNVRQLQKKLQMIDFSLVDTILYLDAYPNCKKALDYYHRLLSEREAVAHALAEAGMPTNPLTNTAESWNWIKSPWPWEYEANI